MEAKPDRTHDLIFVASRFQSGRFARVLVETVAWHPAEGARGHARNGDIDVLPHIRRPIERPDKHPPAVNAPG